MELKVKAGKFNFEVQTQKVKVCKQKGLIHVIRNEEQETHFKWVNLETHIQEIDLIVFAGDAKFEPVADKKNTFVLRFQMDENRYFFWLQEKTDQNHFVAQINRIINLQEENNEMIDEALEQPKPEKKQQLQSNPVPKVDAGKLADMIRKFGQKHAPQKNITAITNLLEVITHETPSKVMASFNEEEKTNLLQFLPEEMKDVKYLNSNLRSPQFLQALDSLSDALNSQNSVPLFQELGLNKKYLQQYYGVEAFLMALLEWAKQQK